MRRWTVEEEERESSDEICCRPTCGAGTVGDRQRVRLGRARGVSSRTTLAEQKRKGLQSQICGWQPKGQKYSHWKTAGPVKDKLETSSALGVTGKNKQV